MPYVSQRWVGGTITNWEEIKKNLDKLTDLKSKKEEGKFKDFTKKENLLIDRKIARLEFIFGGLVGLEKIPEAIFVVDVKKEIGAVKEANEKGVKVIGLIDTNGNPDLVDYIIPANDDGVKSIELVINFMAEAVEEGRREAGEEKKETKETKVSKVKKAKKEN